MTAWISEDPYKGRVPRKVEKYGILQYPAKAVKKSVILLFRSQLNPSKWSWTNCLNVLSSFWKCVIVSAVKGEPTYKWRRQWRKRDLTYPPHRVFTVIMSLLAIDNLYFAEHFVFCRASSSFQSILFFAEYLVWHYVSGGHRGTANAASGRWSQEISLLRHQRRWSRGIAVIISRFFTF